MKKYIFIVVTIAIIAGSLAPVKAVSDWSYRIGVQYWKPDWTFDKSLYSYDGSTDGAYGPVLFLGYRDFGLGLNYYAATFDVEKSWEQDGEKHVERSSGRDRTDFDLYLTYRFLKYFQAIVGYKYLDFEKEEQGFIVQTTVTGPAVGLAGGYPLGSTNIFVYGSFFYMPKLTGDEEWKGSELAAYDTDADGYNLEAGVGYSLTMLDIFIMNFKGGYRLQNFNYEFGNDSIYPVDNENYDGFRLEVLTIW